VVHPSVQVNDRLILLVQGEVVSKTHDLVRSDRDSIQLCNSVTELLLDDLLCESRVMTHQINLGVLCLAGTSSLSILRLGLIIALLLSKHNTKVDAFVDQRGFNVL
jgi:hypothetical protein